MPTSPNLHGDQVKEDLSKIPLLFQISGTLLSFEAHKSGHINQTYLSTFQQDGAKTRYVHQRINEHVFKDVSTMMNNIEFVLNHLSGASAKGVLRPNDQILSLVPARTGSNFARAEDGFVWRTYKFIENTYSLDVCPDASTAAEAAALLGRFQRAVSDIDCNRLKETISSFFSSPYRYQQLRQSIPQIANKRSALAAKDLEFALQREELCNIIESARNSGAIPTRVVHGDMKLNNVLFCSVSRQAICLVDFDTCMPGYSLYDFGDLVRSGSVMAAEDEEDLSKVSFNLEFFPAFVKGYLAQAQDFLTPFEFAIMPLVPRVLALTLGVRFLADYLNNDSYFKVTDDGQNLRRARTQFRLVAEMERLEAEMKKIVADNFSS